MSKKNHLTACTQYLCISLLIAYCFTGCKEDEDDGPTPNVPTTTFSQIQLSQEKTEPGAAAVTTTYTYLYDRGRLITFNTLQSYKVIEPEEIRLSTNVTYKDHQAVITDENGTTATYTLNDKGYAVSCEYQEGTTIRNYTFDYIRLDEPEEYCLKEVTENINGAKYSSVQIDYSTEGVVRITQQVSTYEPQVYSLTLDENLTNNSEIPCLFLAELYPVSFHPAALYGKLLGDTWKYLVTRLSIAGSSEITKYDYILNDTGIITSCDETVVDYGKIRTVNYHIK